MKKAAATELKASIALLEALAAMTAFSPRRRARFLRSAEKRRRKLLLLDVPESGPHPHEAESARPPHDGLESTGTGQTSQNLPRGSDAIDTDLPPDEAPGRILVVCQHAPTVSHAGGLRILDMLHKIKTKHPQAHVEIFTSANIDLYGPMSEAMQIADRIVTVANYDFSLAEYSRQTPRIRSFDVIDFQFPQPVEVVREYRKIGRKLIFTPMESHIRNEAIARGEPIRTVSDLSSSDALLEAAICTVVDQTVCVSKTDRDAIAACLPHNVIAIETGVSEIEFSGQIRPIAPSDRAVCFVAYFGSETNRAALRWYLEKVHPLVVEAVPDYEFRIIGRGEVSDILPVSDRNLRYIGEVERVAPHIAAAAVGIAPALSGSGFRGKINQYAQLGVPTVANALAADGFAYSNGSSILVADKPEEFASAIARLLTQPEARREMGSAAAAICRDVYGWEARWPMIAEVYELPPEPDVLRLPSVHALVPSYRHADFIEERIRSILAQQYGNIRITVIDDASTDGSHEIIERLRREHDFDYIRREKNSGSPFSAWAHAAENTTEDLIWICESDDSCDPLMVGRLVRQLTRRRQAKMAYCGSVLVNDAGEVVGSTDSYFADVFHPTRWRSAFVARGRDELRQYQRFGMTVPNMSSLIIDAAVFRAAFTPDVQSYRLAGDWLFVGRALQLGDIVYVPERLNHFRAHERTARVDTQQARRMAEHVSVRLKLCALAEVSEAETAAAVRHDLRDLAEDSGLAQATLVELETFDADSAQHLRRLLDEFCPEGVAGPRLAELFA